MDTTYYTFETRKIRVSGGDDLLTFVPTAATAPAGEVLDFARCRRKLETKAAWQDFARTVGEVKVPVEEAEEETDPAQTAALNAAYEAAVPAPRRVKATKTPVVARKPQKAAPRKARASGWLELCASVATILVCVCAGWGFLALV